MTDRATAICLPTARFGPRVAMATRKHCEICAEEVWVAPTSEHLAREMHYICIDCAPGVMETVKGARLMSPTPEQLAELTEILLPDKEEQQ